MQMEKKPIKNAASLFRNFGLKGINGRRQSMTMQMKEKQMNNAP